MTNDLKIRLLETLKYPRYLIRAELKLEDCPHDGHFSTNDSHCQECEDAQDCRWLFTQDEEAALDQRTLDQLISALGYAIESIESLVDETQHDELCHCETCLWRKQADALYGEARCHPELGPPPMPH